MTHTKAIRQYAHNDYAALVDNEIIGYASTGMAAMELANDYVYALVQHEARYIADEATPAPAAAVATPSAPSTPLLAPSRAAVAAALVAARAACADKARWLRAANKAAVELETGKWAFNGRVLVVRSRSSARQYRATATTCECPAYAKAAPCWHRAAARLVTNAIHAVA